MSAQGLDGSVRRDVWRQSESDHWAGHVIDEKAGTNDVEYLMERILNKYIVHVNPHIKQVGVGCVSVMSTRFPLNKESSVLMVLVWAILTGARVIS